MSSLPTLLIRLLAGVLTTITIYPNTSLALPLDVEVLERSYTTLYQRPFKGSSGMPSLLTPYPGRSVLPRHMTIHL
jgi:hypothetical protein